MSAWRSPSNVCLELAKLELRGHNSKLYSHVPSRLATQIEDILDPEKELKSCVLLGFSRDGDHLISYTSTPVAAADGKNGYCLQLWSFERCTPCRKLWTVPLFRCDTSLDHPEEDDDFGGVSGSLSVTVAETPCGELLVVHGRPTEVEKLDRLVNHITIIPGPRYAVATQLQVLHLSYHTAPPHPPFNPFLSILTPPSPAMLSLSNACSVTLACNMGDGLQLLNVAVSAPPCAVHLRQPAQQQQQQEEATQRLAHQSYPRQQQQQPEMQSQANAALQQQGQGPPKHQQPLLAEVNRQLPTHPQQVHSSAGGAPAAGPGIGTPAGSTSEQCCAQHAPSCCEPSVEPHVKGARLPLCGADQMLTLHPGCGDGGRHPPPPQEQQHECSTAVAAGSLPGALSNSEPGASTTAMLEQLRAEMNLREDIIPCCSNSSCRAVPGAGPSCAPPPGARVAAARALPAGAGPLDWEEFIFEAVRRQGVLLQSLEDYGSALAAQGAWQGQAGLLAVALLRLRGVGQGPVSQCLLVHMAAATGMAEVVEVVEAPFPWQEDLSRAMQRSGPAGAVVLDRLAAYVADWLRCRQSAPCSRHQLPHVLTNRSVLGEGKSLKYIMHPWLPQCILGYGAGARTHGGGER